MSAVIKLTPSPHPTLHPTRRTHLSAMKVKRQSTVSSPTQRPARVDREREDAEFGWLLRKRSVF